MNIYDASSGEGWPMMRRNGVVKPFNFQLHLFPWKPYIVNKEIWIKELIRKTKNKAMISHLNSDSQTALTYFNFYPSAHRGGM